MILNVQLIFCIQPDLLEGVYKVKVEEEFVYGLPFDNCENITVFKNKNLGE